MSRSAKWTKFCKNYFLGKGFCKTSANVFEIRLGSEFRPRGGGVWGGIRAGFPFLKFPDTAKKVEKDVLEFGKKERFSVCSIELTNIKTGSIILNMKERFEPGRENPQELVEKHSGWINQQLKSFVDSSPLLQEWKSMDKDRKETNAYFIGGVTLTGIIGLMGFYEADAKFMAEVSAGIAGGVLTTDTMLRIGRFLKEKLGFGGENKSEGENK